MPILKNKFQFARKLIKSNLRLNGCDEDSTHSLLEILPKIAFWSYNSWAVFWSNKIFIGIFGSTLQCCCFFFSAFFSGLLDWIVLSLLWFERPLPHDGWLNSSCSWPFKTDDVTSSRWDVGGCGGSAANGITANKKCAIFFRLCLLTSLDKNEL